MSSRDRSQGRSLSIRARDAHAWVEVFSLEEGVWFPIDPTPQQVLVDAGGGWLIGTVAALQESWAVLTRFDAGSRSIPRVPGLPARGAGARGRGPPRIAHRAGLLLVLLALRARARRLGPPASVTAMNRAFDRAGLELRAHETPREG